MFKHLLVPLDGSRLAEAALPAAAYLAERLNATITLVHIIERGAAAEIHGERHLTSPDEACAYLGDVAARAFASRQEVERHVHTTETDDVALGIAGHIEELRPDLIVMCTHGHGGLRDVLYGSIAQQVVARGTVPVLLIQPGVGDSTPDFRCGRMLVPLDASPEHQQGLTAATELAHACQAVLHLVLVVPTLATLSGDQAGVRRLLPGAMAHLLDISSQEAKVLLLNHMQRLRAEGLTATTEVARGDPAALIVKTAARMNADVIVLGTHGKSGMDAFWAGSIAPRVSAHSRLPLLLVPVAQVQ